MLIRLLFTDFVPFLLHNFKRKKYDGKQLFQLVVTVFYSRFSLSLKDSHVTISISHCFCSNFRLKLADTKVISSDGHCFGFNSQLKLEREPRNYFRWSLLWFQFST